MKEARRSRAVAGADGIEKPEGRCAKKKVTIMVRIQTSQARSPEPLLLREMAHRVSNEYSAAITALSLAAARTSSPEAKAAISAAADRLHDYVDAHRALQMPRAATYVDLSDYLSRVCSTIVPARLRDRGIHLVLATEQVLLGELECWYAGLIIAELITNAAKHAFGTGGGTIRVEIAHDGDRIQCSVSDDGSHGRSDHQGQGSEIVSALAARLGATMSRDFGARGTSVVLTLPVRGGPPYGLTCRGAPHDEAPTAGQRASVSFP
jgi:two-component sensor histidine kinase